tara:strand:+ start:659 stop:1147 length:489 start_codon:yes stop_codon:yes gene_type:complete
MFDGVCITTGITTFLVVLYCCIGIDMLAKYINYDLLVHPLTKFAVLSLIALVFCKDHYVAHVIGISYLLTILKLLEGKKTDSVVKSPKVSFDADTKYVESDYEEETLDSDIQKPNIDSKSAFTTEAQFKDVQSNIVSDDALKTEVRTWQDGYGTQGGLMPQS